MPSVLVPLGAHFLPLISAVAKGLGVSLDDHAVAGLVTWLDLMATWNAKVDLTAARSADELVDLMLADAIVLARHEPQANTVVDVGSGAGGPGLALSLSRPDLAVTLVEPRDKRVSFLRTVAGQLPRPEGRGGSLRVVRAQGEDLVRQGASFDSAVARAVLAPEPWLRLGARLAPAGAVWVLLAREPPPLLDGWEIDLDEPYIWPLTGAARRAVRYRRAAAPESI